MRIRIVRAEGAGRMTHPFNAGFVIHYYLYNTIFTLSQRHKVYNTITSLTCVVTMLRDFELS